MIYQTWFDCEDPEFDGMLWNCDAAEQAADLYMDAYLQTITKPIARVFVRPQDDDFETLCFEYEVETKAVRSGRRLVEDTSQPNDAGEGQ